MLSQNEIIKAMKDYSSYIDSELINKAYLYTLEKHGIQTRESGDPFFYHPFEVAKILIELKMDQYTIVAGLLHDTVEDTNATLEEINKLFGESVANLVKGVTKLSKLEGFDIATKQEENYKTLLLYAASDIRVLIIKLADRLHNIRTLNKKKSRERKMSIARETIEIYAPLAERIGLRRIKDELQNTAFYTIYPSLFKTIRDKLHILYESEEEILGIIKDGLSKVLNQTNLNYSITGRLKTPFSIWNKMNIRTLSFEQLSDIVAFRIIVQNVQECYQVLGNIHKNFLVIPGRFRDYISIPKNNKYQSLHTCIIGPLNKRIEIQIRTREMHFTAEYGIASHWRYKEGQISNDNSPKWLKDMIERLDKSNNMDEFIKYSKTEIIAEHTFGITPKGKIIPLPIGSTILDFAYAVHTEVGNHAIGAKVNGVETSLSTLIETGDQIEIITSDTAMPKKIWQTYAITTNAKSAIRKTLSISKSKILNINSEIIINTNNNLNNTIVGLPNKNIAKTKCCSPIPGDKIVGITFPDSDKEIVEIHIEDCANIRKKMYDNKSSIIDIYWNPQCKFTEKIYISSIIIYANNYIGNLSKISSVLDKQESEILNIRIYNKSKPVVNIYIELYVSNIIHLNSILNSISALDFVLFAQRVVNLSNYSSILQNNNLY